MYEKVQKATKSHEQNPEYWLCCSSIMLAGQHVGTINPNPESSVCKIRSSGDAGLIHHLAECLSPSCCVNWGKDKCGLLQWPLEASGHWHEAKMLCVCAGWEGAARRWHWWGKGSTGCTRINSTKWIFFFSTGYVQLFDTIYTRMWEYKQLAEP